MKKLMMAFAVGAAVLAGCQTRITAEKYPETPLPIQEVVVANGMTQLVTKAYAMASGGWYVTARSPLFAKEAIRGLDVGAQTNGTVYLRTDSYDRDVSTNAIVMVKTIFDGSANLVDACAKAYASIQTAGAATATGAIAEKIAAYFKSKGGNDAKSTVTADAASKTVTVTDGATSIVCDEAGNCSPCTDGSCAPATGASAAGTLNGI